MRLEPESTWGAPGDTARLVTRILSRERTLMMTVTTFESKPLVTYTSTQPGLPDARHERIFEGDGDGFVYRLVVEYEPRARAAGLLDRLLLPRGIRRAFQQTFAALERRAQASAHPESNPRKGSSSGRRERSGLIDETQAVGERPSTSPLGESGCQKRPQR